VAIQYNKQENKLINVQEVFLLLKQV